MLDTLIDYGYYISFAVLILAVILLRLIYAFIVYLNGKKRYLDNPIYWSVFSVLFGLPAFVMFFALNAGQGVKAPVKKAHKVTFSVLFALVLCLCFAFVPLRVYESARVYASYSSVEVYEINPFKYVAYDKTGKAYNVMSLDAGRIKNYIDGSYNNERVPVYYEDGEQYNGTDAMINSDGYAVRDFNEADYENRIYEKDDSYFDLYFDKDGNVYYHYYNCSWDKDGNLVIVGLDETPTVDNTEAYDDYIGYDEMNGFDGYSYYDSINGYDNDY